MAALGAILLVALGAVVFGAGGSTPPPAAGNGNAVHWVTNVVELHAADFWIEANGQRFTAIATPLGRVAVVSAANTPASSHLRSYRHSIAAAARTSISASL